MVRFQGYHEDVDRRGLDLSYLRRLWPFVRPYRRPFAVCLAILVVSFFTDIAGPYLLRLAIDGPVTAAVRGEQPPGGEVALLGAGYLLVTLLGIGLGYAFAMLTARAGQGVIRDVRVALFGHILRLGPRFFDRNAAGRLVTRVTSDVENLNELISTGVLQTAFDLMKIVGILAVLVWIDADLALIPVVATPILITISLLFRSRVRESFRRVRGRLGRQNAFTAEAVGGVRVTRIFGQEQLVEDHAAELKHRTRDAWIEAVWHFANFFASVDLALRLTQVGILWAGGAWIAGGDLTAGVFVQFWICFGKLTEPLRELGERYNVLQSAFSSSERIFGILDQPLTTPAPAAPVPMPRGPAALRLEGVEFEYVPGRPVLHGIDLAVEPGRKVALVGPTGAGKTTVLALVSRLYDPTAGRITIDGIPLVDVDPTALRRRIAVVPQDVFLFTGTILDNVRLFDASIPEARVREALDTVGATSFVERLPGGIHAPVQERGATFSLGERQLLAFARALAADPDLLILDEATANIDNRSEDLIQRGLDRLLRGRTSLVVAHRLSTVRDADRIVVLRAGRIVEAGTHRELVARRGVYAGMVELA